MNATLVTFLLTSASTQARRMQQAAAAKKSKTSAEPSPSANNAAAGGKCRVLGVRCQTLWCVKRLLSCQPVTATELERVFAGYEASRVARPWLCCSRFAHVHLCHGCLLPGHGVRVTSLTAATAILSCKHGAALPCALSLHRWKEIQNSVQSDAKIDRSHASADGAILRMVKFAIAPVTAAGRAAAGSQDTKTNRPRCACIMCMMEVLMHASLRGYEPGIAAKATMLVTANR
eukprot:3313356-Amphidinium_carterae.3